MIKLTRNNIGRFKMTKELLREAEMRDLLIIFKDIFILKIVENFETSQVLYVGVSPMFRPVEQGNNIPLYSIDITQSAPGKNRKSRMVVKANEVEDDGTNWVYM